MLYLRKENKCLHAIHHSSIAIHSLSIHQLLYEQLAELSASLDIITGYANTTTSTSTPIEVEGGGVTKWLRAAKWHQLEQLHITHTHNSYLHAPTSPANCVVIYSGCLLTQALANIWHLPNVLVNMYRYHVMVKCMLLLCAWSSNPVTFTLYPAVLVYEGHCFWTLVCKI